MSSSLKIYSASFWLGFLFLGSFIQNANSFTRGRDSPFPASAPKDTEEKESSSSEETEVIQVVSSSHNSKDPSSSSSISFDSGNKPNKTRSSQLIVHEDQQLREILCPGTSLLYRYDLRAGKCAQLDTQSHCGRNMIFTTEADSSTYGYCECDFDSHNFPLVFHLRTNQCHPIYSQAYCQSGEWLVISPESRGPICQRNHCLGGPGRKSKSPPGSGRRSKLLFPGFWDTPENDSPRRDHPVKLRSFSVKNAEISELSSTNLFVPLNGTGPCVTLGQSSKYCRPEEKVLIPTGKIAPRCTVPGNEGLERGLTLIPDPCPPGSYYSIIGYCQPVWDF